MANDFHSLWCETSSAENGLDDTARPEGDAPGVEKDGAVVFRVKLDGKLLMERPMSWKDSPLPVDLAVTGGKRLSLEVDYGEEGADSNPAIERFALDRANWAEARLIR